MPFILLFVLLFSPLNAFAHGVTVSVGYYGTTSTSSTFMLADSSANDDDWIDLKVGGGDGQVIWYNRSGEIGRSSTPASINAPSNANAFKLKSNDGKEVYAIEGHTTNPNSQHVNFAGSNGSTDPKPEPDPPTPLPEEPDCTLCQCRDDLVSAMNTINSSVNSNGQKLDKVVTGVKDLNTKASKSNNLLGSILGELKSDLMPKLPNMPKPPSLSKNKPNMPDQSYKNEKSYFKDSGETSKDPKPLPTAPEPEKWKGTDGKEINPEKEMKKDAKNNRDGQMDKDSELSKDDQLNKDGTLSKDGELDRDSEMDKDKFNRDSEMDMDKQQQRDSTLESDKQMNRDTVSEMDDKFDRDNFYSDDDSLEKSPIIGRDNFYNQSPIDHTPPDWKSD